MGNKVEGDIVGWSPTKETPKGQQMMPKRHKGAARVGTDAAGAAGTVLFDENGLARNALRQPYRQIEGGGAVGSLSQIILIEWLNQIRGAFN